LVDGLKRSMGKLPPKSRYGILFFDEVKVKEGLVYNAHTGDLIGVCEEGADVGTHVLQFFWSCTYTNFSYPLAFFVTKTANYLDISKYFWDGKRGNKKHCTRNMIRDDEQVIWAHIEAVKKIQKETLDGV